MQLTLKLLLFGVLISLAVCQTCIEDSLEPNNDFATATVITLPYVNANLTACANESDYFTFTASQAGVLQVELDFADGDLDIFIYQQGTSPQLITDSQKTFNIYEALSTTIQGGTTYFIQVVVYTAPPSNSTYTINARIVPACAPDSQEPNNAFDTAILLLPGVLVTNLTVCDSNTSPDEDWFRFTLNETAYVEITATYNPVPYATSLDLILFDSNRQNLSATDPLRFDVPAFLNGTLNAGTYHLQITQNIFVWDTPYTLLLTVGQVSGQDTNPTVSSSTVTSVTSSSSNSQSQTSTSASTSSGETSNSSSSELSQTSATSENTTTSVAPTTRVTNPDVLSSASALFSTMLLFVLVALL